MRLSLQKAAHAAVEWIRVQEIRVKPGFGLSGIRKGKSLSGSLKPVAPFSGDRYAAFISPDLSVRVSNRPRLFSLLLEARKHLDEPKSRRTWNGLAHATWHKRAAINLKDGSCFAVIQRICYLFEMRFHRGPVIRTE